MENKDRLGKILLVTLVLVLGFVAYKRTDTSSSTTVTTEQDSKAEPLLAKEDVEKIVHEYILNNPSIIIESIEKMHKKKVDELTAKTVEVLKSKKDEIEKDKMSPSVGDGPVNITMIYDYSCNYCKKASMVVDKLLSDNDQVRVIYKPYPILGDASDYMTKVALSVYKLFPDKFRTIHQSMVSRKIASREDVVKILEENNLPVITIESEFENPEIKTSLEKLVKLAQTLKIQGVPVFIINDTLYPGLIELPKLKEIIEPLMPAAKEEEEEELPNITLDNTPPSPSKDKEAVLPAAPAEVGHDEPVALDSASKSAENKAKAEEQKPIDEPKPQIAPIGAEAPKEDKAHQEAPMEPKPASEASVPQAPKAIPPVPKLPEAPKPKQLLKEAPKPKKPVTPPTHRTAN